MTPKLTFIESVGPRYLVYRGYGTKRERFLGAISKDPRNGTWSNNHFPKSYPTKAKAAEGLLSK